MDSKGLRKLTEYECLKLQGFPPEYKFPDEIPRSLGDRSFSERGALTIGSNSLHGVW
jgi:hypothetical protein